MGSFLGAALNYARRGFSVIPLRPRDKRPLLSSWAGFQQAPADADQVQAWWIEHSDANVGIVTGAVSGLVVLDLDGPEAVNFIKERDPNPETPVARTGKGYHVYFAHPGGTIANAVALGGIKGMDLRADGGYVVAPPSIHPSGKRYQWVGGHSPDELPLASCPNWLLDLIRNPGKTEVADVGQDPSWVLKLLQGVPQGQRNDAATRLAGHWLARLPGDEVWLLLTEWNTRNSPPLPERELKAIFESVARREARKPRRPNGEAKQETPPEPVVIPLANVEPEEVSWLWEPYLPAGKLTIVEGDPGAGKTWVTLAICAKLTAEGHPVLYATAEDGLADTIRPRVEGMGADLSSFFILRGAKSESGDTVPFTLAEPEVLEKAILTYRPALVVLDPIQGFLGGSVDMHKANEVRAKLAPLARIAETYGCAVAVVRHLSKAPAGRAIYRGLGSIDFTAAARSVLLVGQNQAGNRAVVHLKNSVGELGPSLGFEIQRGQFFWRGEVDTEAGDILRPDAEPEERSALDEAAEWLQELLAEGPVEAKQVQREAKQAGFADITLRRAKARLGIRVSREGTPGERGGGKWFWRLPDYLDDQDDQPPLNSNDEHLNQEPQTLEPQAFPGTDLDAHMSILNQGVQTLEPQGFQATDLDAHLVSLEDEHLSEQVNQSLKAGNVENRRDVLRPVDELDGAITEMLEEMKGK
ncbi:MAG: bifunctional DNA primase/polymerase [Bacillota bacterium]